MGDSAQVDADREIIDLVEALRDTGNLHPLIARLRDGEVEPETALDTLLVLLEYDPHLLVQITLDSLICEYVDDSGSGAPTSLQEAGSPDRWKPTC
jgi:hypothetical protein